MSLSQINSVHTFTHGLFVIRTSLVKRNVKYYTQLWNISNNPHVQKPCNFDSLYVSHQVLHQNTALLKIIAFIKHLQTFNGKFKPFALFIFNILVHTSILYTHDKII